MEDRIRGLTVTLLLVYAGPLCCRGSWMYLGVSPGLLTSSSSSSSPPPCSSLPLSGRQRELCRKQAFLLPAVRDGARLAVSECRSQFRHERWNCPISSRQEVFTLQLTSGTKETAFLHSVMAAGLVHAVTRACSLGNITECGCDAPTKTAAGAGVGSAPAGPAPAGPAPAGPAPAGSWHWAGCSDQVQYGLWLSRKFMENGVLNQTTNNQNGFTLSTMNNHNSEAGRQAVVSTMSTSCRCHGVSGSCAVKTCWKMAAAFHQVGVYLKDQYERSVQVRDRRRRKTRRKEAQGGASSSSSSVPPDARRLVFINKSPNYCVADARRGVAGTTGRSCNRTSAGTDGCFLLCCGRGHNTHLVRRVDRCSCKFVWCCYVSCRRCESIQHIHTCK